DRAKMKRWLASKRHPAQPPPAPLVPPPPTVILSEGRSPQSKDPRIPPGAPQNLSLTHESKPVIPSQPLGMPNALLPAAHTILPTLQAAATKENPTPRIAKGWGLNCKSTETLRSRRSSSRLLRRHRSLRLPERIGLDPLIRRIAHLRAELEQIRRHRLDAC